MGEKTDVQSREKWWNELRDVIRGHCEMYTPLLHCLPPDSLHSLMSAVQVQVRLRAGLQGDPVYLIRRLHHVRVYLKC